MNPVPKRSEKKNKEMIDDSNVFVKMLHDAAACGNKRKVCQILKTGLDVDHPNSLGQTALFVACFEGQRHLAKLLLKHGANPNFRNLEGSTPVHAASFNSDKKLVGYLLNAGGDLRLHDYSGRNPRHWAARQPDSRKRNSFLDFFEESRSRAHFTYGTIPLSKLSFHYPVYKKFQRRQKNFQKKLPPMFQNFGFGLVVDGRFGYQSAVLGRFPMIPESHLKHDNTGPTYNNGQFMVMESMIWKSVPVTVKRLHRGLSVEEANVDFLIKELEYVSSLQHPNILLLMAVCMNNTLEGMVLLYEKVRCGSLDTLLYQRGQLLMEKDILKIFYQISNALVFLHQQGIIHCCLTPHAIQLIEPNFAKLSNFEYSCESASRKFKRGPASLNFTDGKWMPKFACNWLSPEILSGQKIISEESDVYSLAAILWEALSGSPPWCGKQPNEIKVEMLTNKNQIPLGNIGSPFHDLLDRGLSLDPIDRVSMISFRDLMWQGLRNNLDVSERHSYHHHSHYSPSNHPDSNACLSFFTPDNRSPEKTALDPNTVDLERKRSVSKKSAEVSNLQELESMKSVPADESFDTVKLEKLRNCLSELEKVERPSQRPEVEKARHHSPQGCSGTEFKVHVTVNEYKQEEQLLNKPSGVVEPDKGKCVDYRLLPEQVVKMDEVGTSAREQVVEERQEDVGKQFQDADDRRGPSEGTQGNGLVYSVHEIRTQHGFAKSSGTSYGLEKEGNNPFLDEDLRQQSEELCKQLLKQPIHKLPFQQKLINKPDEGDSVQKPTVYGTIIRKYSQEQSAEVYTRRYGSHGRPTFGVSLRELKAAVRSHVASGFQEPSYPRDTTSSSHGPNRFNMSSAHYSSSKGDLEASTKVSSFKPASHREPSLNISPSKHSLHHPFQNFSIPPPPTSSSSVLGSGSYAHVAESWGAANTERHHRRTSPIRGSLYRYNIMAAASSDPLDKSDDDETDYTARFRSDPLLQGKLQPREFSSGETYFAKPATMHQGPFHKEATSQDIMEDDDNLKEFIGNYWDRPQAGPLSWNKEPSRVWSKTSQIRFTSGRNGRCPGNGEDSKRKAKQDGNTQVDAAIDSPPCRPCDQDLPSETSRPSQSLRQKAGSFLNRKEGKADSRAEAEKSATDSLQKVNHSAMRNSGKKQHVSESNSAVCEDFYFDDEFNSSTLYKENYLRLQSTMALDSNASASSSVRLALSSFNSPLLDSRGGNNIALPSSGSKQNVGSQTVAVPCAGKSSASRNFDASFGSMKPAACSDKALSVPRQHHNSSTVTVESDALGHHKICLKRVDPQTGTETTTYKASLVADQVITQVFINNDDDHQKVNDDNDDANTSDNSSYSSDDSEKLYRV